MERMTELLAALTRQTQLFIANYWSEWTLIQFAIIALTVFLSGGLARIAMPAFDAQVRSLTGQRALMRLLVIPLRSVRWIIAVCLLWLVALVMREFLWPSRSYVVFLAAKLLTAWHRL